MHVLGLVIEAAMRPPAFRCQYLRYLIPEYSTNRTIPKYIFLRFLDKQRLTSSRPDAMLIVPMK
eukprot:1155782-Pelagomonas_calceolata.AAC.2